MPTDKEYRARAEVRVIELEGNDQPTIVGYAAVFDAMSNDLGGFREKIRPGAFTETLERQDDVAALFSHDSSSVLGRRSAGTLRLEQDSVGLRVEIDAPNTTIGRDVVESIRRGDLDAMSFGFVVEEEEWARDDEGEVRTLNSVSLFDVSVVTWPAYPDTSVAVRSMEAHIASANAEEKRQEEEGYKPTKQMAELAERGLALREEFGRGGTEVGVARARDISNMENLSVDTIKRMASFFARHRVDLDAPAANPDNEDYPSAGVIAWMLWGGDPNNPDGAGVAWADSKLAKLEGDAESDNGDYARSIKLRLEESEL